TGPGSADIAKLTTRDSSQTKDSEEPWLPRFVVTRSQVARETSVREGVLKMLNCLMGAILLVALTSSPIAFAQNGQRGPQGGRAGTASSKAFDPHDLSGFWDLTSTGLAPGALNATSNNRPQMTPEGLAKFRKTKTGIANALSNGAFPNEKDW